MKKFLLFTLLAFTLSATSQVIFADDFNSLELGALSSDITGGTISQNGWFVFANNGEEPTTTDNTAVTNFEIVEGGNNDTQGLKMETMNGDKGNRVAAFAFDYNTIIAGNDFIEMEFDFYTGEETTSTAPVLILLNGGDLELGIILGGFYYVPNTRQLLGLAYLNYNGVLNNYAINLVNEDNVSIVLDSNTWYSYSVSYNTSNGAVAFSGPGIDGDNSNDNLTEYLAGPFTPKYIRIAAVPSPDNTSSSTFIFDNFTVEASVPDEVLSLDDNFTATKFSIYPNPASDIINISLGNLQIKQVQITDINGRVVKTFETEITSEAQINIQNLNSGLYMMSIFTNEGVRTSKFIKK